MPSPEEIKEQAEKVKWAIEEGTRLIISVDQKESDEILAKHTTMIGIALIRFATTQNLSVPASMELKGIANTLFMTGFQLGKEKQKETDKLEAMMRKEVT